MASRSEIVAISTTISLEVALSAYRKGIFPWPVDDKFVFWYCPSKRGVLFIKQFSPDKNLLKTLKKKSRINFVFNWQTTDELLQCRNYHLRKHGDTWISSEMIKFYCEAFKNGNFFSLSAFNANQNLGSIFCIKINDYISAETMYSRQSNGSKIALFGLVKFLEKHGVEFIDIQVLNTVTFKLGGIELPKKRFLELLKSALNSNSLSLVEEFYLDF